MSNFPPGLPRQRFQSLESGVLGSSVYIYLYIYLSLSLSIYIYIYINRGEWLILGTTYPIMQRSGMRRARRERDTFFTILPAHGVTVAATLSHKGQQQVISVPIDSGPFCVDQKYALLGQL